MARALVIVPNDSYRAADFIAAAEAWRSIDHSAEVSPTRWRESPRRVAMVTSRLISALGVPSTSPVGA